MKRANFLSPLKYLFPCFLFFLVLGLSSLAAQDDRTFPWSLGAGLEVNLNTREGMAMGYGAGLDRYFFYDGDRGVFRAGVKAVMHTDFDSITGMEADLYARVNILRIWRGDIFTQLSWGVATFREDALTANTMLMDFTAGYRFTLVRGFYLEPYVRTGFPFLFGGGITAGHRLAF